MVLSRHLLYWMTENPGPDIDWQAVTDEALVVPESTPLESLLKTFQARQRHLAVVVDEFGSVHGIATLEDVIEEVVGEIYDESDEQPPRSFQQEREGAVVFRASSDLRRVCSVLGLSWEPEENATTLGGLVAERLGRIPLQGDSIAWRGFRIEVLTATPRRADTVRIAAEPQTII
jgi:CBS domain containing-hemolysin-like protein